MIKIFLNAFNNSIWIKGKTTKIIAIEYDYYRECISHNETPRAFWEFDSEYEYRKAKKEITSLNGTRMKKFYI